MKRNLYALAASTDDLGRTSVITHTIRTIRNGDAKPFRHMLRKIPFAHWQYFEKKIKKLL